MTYPYNEQSDGGKVKAADWANILSKHGGRITDVGMYPILGFSYGIFKVGSKYYRRDGNDGEDDDSNADARPLLQAAIDALT